MSGERRSCDCMAGEAVELDKLYIHYQIYSIP